MLSANVLVFSFFDGWHFDLTLLKRILPKFNSLASSDPTGRAGSSSLSGKNPRTPTGHLPLLIIYFEPALRQRFISLKYLACCSSIR
jgi:hypothetical protein